MYYHEIETGLKRHEFGIQDRLLRRRITKIVITRIQYIFQWDFPREPKVAMGDPYINSDCDFFGQPFVIKSTCSDFWENLSELS